MSTQVTPVGSQAAPKFPAARPSSTAKPKLKIVPQDPRTASLEGLYLDPRYADLIIKCGDKEFKVHKSVVCTRSHVLAIAVSDRWKSSQASQDHDGLQIIEDNLFEPDMMERLLCYLYTGDYLVPDVKQPADAHESIKLCYNDIDTHIAVRAIADYYNVSSLVEVAEKKVETMVGVISYSSDLFGELILKIKKLSPQSKRMDKALLLRAKSFAHELHKDNALATFASKHKTVVKFIFELVGSLTTSLAEKTSEFERAKKEEEKHKVDRALHILEGQVHRRSPRRMP